MKKVLLIATIEDFFNFEKNNISILQNLGYEIHLAMNSNASKRPLGISTIIKHQVDFARNPFSKTNLKAYKELCQIVENEEFDLIHCHTPVGGVVGRIIGHKYHIKTIYTAHGFHFYKGAPLKNWLLFYPIEKFFSRWTDILITINQEDFVQAKNKFYSKRIEYIPGVGVDIVSFQNVKVDKITKREELGIDAEDFVFISIGELSVRKNHEVVIRALAKTENEKIKYLIVGSGDLEDKLKMLTKELNVEHRVVFAGYRKDVKEFLHIADAFAFPSLQEGLPVALMEAMAVGLPVIASRIRGNIDLIEEHDNNMLVKADDIEGYATAIRYLHTHPQECSKIAKDNSERIKQFDANIVNNLMIDIYKKM